LRTYVPRMLTTDPGRDPTAPFPTSNDRLTPPERIGLLSERQKSYLRLVLQNRSSKEIAATTGSSHRAVDKQLLKANNLLGVPTRFDAARLLADHDAGVEPLPPAIALPSDEPTFPLPPAWPTARAAANMMTWKQVASWTTIIAIVVPLGLTAAGMALVTLLLLLGLKPL
jgi:DNA-binding CsgD family transcriptional regulator